MDHDDLPTSRGTRNGDQGSATDALREFRALLDDRREAEDVLASALAARQQASAYADEIVRHSEALARQIEDDARARAEQVLGEAQARAARMIADAEAARVAVLGVIERARTDLSAGGTAPAAPAGVDLLFSSVEAARAEADAVSPPSSPRPRPAWPGFDSP